MDKRKKRKYNKKYNILIVVAGVIILGYIIYAIVNLIFSPTDVFIIEEGKVSMEESGIGYVVREEIVVKGQNYSNGLIAIKSEGEKVAKNEAIFRYYSSDEEGITKQIQEINQKLNDALEKQKELFSSPDIKALDKQIEQKIEGISDYTDIEKIREYKNDINTYLTKKSKIAGENSVSGSYIKQLYDEKDLYESRLAQSTEYVKAPTSGVLSYRVDNLENILTPKNYDNINKELLESLNIKTGQIVSTNNKEGKIINNFECYIATILDTDNAINCTQRSKSENTIVE